MDYSLELGLTCNKIARLASTDNEDRISNLPEDTIGHILSSLPTKEVFRTSVLSKRWRYMWRHAYTMEISDTLYQLPPFERRTFIPCTQDIFAYEICQPSIFERCSNKETFVKLIHRLLFFSKRLRSFRLGVWNKYDSIQVQRWISSILRHNLESLELRCYTKPLPDGIVFPCDLLNSTVLRKLKLCSVIDCYIMNIAVKNCAPNLTSLYLYGVNIVNKDPQDSRTVMFSFPLLEILTLKYCKWFNVKLVEIDAPSLTTFESIPGPGDDSGGYDHTLKILAPRLAIILCEWNLHEKYIFSKGTESSILSAYVRTTFILPVDYDTDADDYNYAAHQEEQLLHSNAALRVGNYMKSFENLEELELSVNIVEMLPLTSLRYDKLRRLRVRSLDDTETLFQLLHMAPSLKFFSIENLKCCYNYEAMENSRLPTCILSHLEEVEILAFFFSDIEYEAVKIFLAGEQLKILRVLGVGRKKVLLKCKETIASFPRSSQSLTFEFGRATPNTNNAFGPGYEWEPSHCCRCFSSEVF